AGLNLRLAAKMPDEIRDRECVSGSDKPGIDDEDEACDDHRRKPGQETCYESILLGEKSRHFRFSSDSAVSVTSRNDMIQPTAAALVLLVRAATASKASFSSPQQVASVKECRGGVFW